MTPDPTLGADIRTALGAVRRRWRLVALVAALAVAAAAAATALQPERHRASAKVVVGQGDALFDVRVQSGSVADAFTQTMGDLVESRVVARRTIAALDLDVSPKELLERLSVSLKPSTTVLHLSYLGDSPRDATRVLRGVTTEFATLVSERFGAAEGAGLTVTAFDPPHLVEQVQPRPKRNLALGALLGLILGLVAAVVTDALDGRVRTGEDAERHFGRAPVGMGSVDDVSRPVAATVAGHLARTAPGAALVVLVAGPGTGRLAAAVSARLREHQLTATVVDAASPLLAGPPRELRSRLAGAAHGADVVLVDADGLPGSPAVDWVLPHVDLAVVEASPRVTATSDVAAARQAADRFAVPAELVLVDRRSRVVQPEPPAAGNGGARAAGALDDVLPSADERPAPPEPEPEPGPDTPPVASTVPPGPPPAEEGGDGLLAAPDDAGRATGDPAGAGAVIDVRSDPPAGTSEVPESDGAVAAGTGGAVDGEREREHDVDGDERREPTGGTSNVPWGV